MDTTLLIETNNGYEALDIYDDLPISVNFSELEIDNLDSRTSPYSQTFTIPGSKINSYIFEHFYEVNGTDFNPLADRKCVVQYRGTDIFRGWLRLNAVLVNYDYYEFEVFITSQVSDLSSVLGSTTLRDLDWSDYTHDISYSAVTESWKASTYSSNGLFQGDILYPMINYGLEYPTGTTNNQPTFTFSMDNNVQGGSITYSANSINPLYFKPAIRIKAVVDKIFSGTGYSYSSEFMDTDYFRSIYMDTAQNGRIGPEMPSGVTSQNFFKVYTPQSVGYTTNNGFQQSFPITQFLADGYDPLGSLHFWDSNNPTDTGYFQVPYTGPYFFNVRFQYQVFYPTAVLPCYFRLRVKIADTPQDLENGGSILWQSPGIGFPAVQTPQNANIFFSGSVSAGQFIKPYIYIENQSGYAGGVFINGYNGITLQDGAPMWELYSSPFLTTASTVNMQYQMPDLTCLDFMKGLVNQFNLVISEPQQDNRFLIEPLPWYFDENNRTERDWNEFLDISKTVKIEPLGFELPKQVNIRGTYNQDETLNRLYYDANDLIFGERRYLTSQSIPKGDKVIETPFAPIPSDFISGSTNVFIPQLYKLGDNDTELTQSKDPHLFFFVGNRYFYKEWNNSDVSNQRTWYLLDGGTPTPQTTYPHVSHLSSADQVDGNFFSDLNFYPSTDFYFTGGTGLSEYTQNNCYGYFYQTYFDNLYSPEARKYTGTFIMSPQYYSELKLTDKIFIKDASYRIDRIENANLTEPDYTTITLIKDLKSYYKTTLYAPDLGLTPNVPYPTIPPPTLYSFTAVSNFDDFLVCDRDTPLVTYYSTNPSGLVVGATIYDDAGGTTLADTGLYLRLTGSTSIFVIDSLGIAQSNGNC